MPDKNVTITATYKQEDKDDPGDDQKDDQDDEKDDPTDVPKTGDTGSPWVWLLLGGISVVSMSLLILMRKRKKYSV
jgi:LPXTG-motif cell wall-anchored protein